MKLKHIITICACAAIALTGITSQTAFAAEKEHAEKKEKMVIPETTEGIMTEIHKHHGELADVVKSKKLADVHHHAFAIRDLANALPAKAVADKKKQVEGTTKNITKLASDLDESGDANDQAKTEANLKKLDGLIKVLETQFGIKTTSSDHAMQYTCPMHPEVVQDSPGKCPKCGMKLVVKK